eukprot:CAMPEP_0180165170 /NCGR_PEP_ID=MMETSP0986-20121125/30819_1 /TAXON_ID=697907 /ORGANISM="non described non described, Strain CCMP2293" /LENGTH=99 /DNA_ID=CAMNT_0022116113 /DNA_START=181 /DNA_END=477 /DNA_ORIENTATION=+
MALSLLAHTQTLRLERLGLDDDNLVASVIVVVHLVLGIDRAHQIRAHPQQLLLLQPLHLGLGAADLVGADLADGATDAFDATDRAEERDEARDPGKRPP